MSGLPLAVTRAIADWQGGLGGDDAWMDVVEGEGACKGEPPFINVRSQREIRMVHSVEGSGGVMMVRGGHFFSLFPFWPFPFFHRSSTIISCNFYLLKLFLF